MSEEDLAGKLIADLRTRLLDLTNSNRLLSYKHPERAKTYVRVVDEQPDFLHDSLTNGKQLSFRPLPDPENGLPDELTNEFLMALEEARLLDEAWNALLHEEEDIASSRAMKIDRQIRDKVRAQLDLPPARGGKLVSISDWARLNGIEPSFDLPQPVADEDREPKHIDSEIQTLLLPDELQGKMAGVMDHARTAQQEMGVNLLHMAIGFLEWYETPAAEKPLLAPLLLYPADLERKPLKGKGQYRYFLRGEQEPVINITLRQRLASQFNLIVPELEEQDTPETYMARMSAVIEELPRWKIRRFATLGLFSFSRLAMFNDLDPAKWGGDAEFSSAGVLGQLFGRREAGPLQPENHDLEDPVIEAEVPLLIRDADSSQHRAIIDVMRGTNLVIKGPPGTGKSQTIANIIAATLAKGKTVLFVAEKAAALDVVKKRLDEAGLGDFCFELHSTKAKKADVLANLDRRLNLKPASQAVATEAALDELHTLRQRLSVYAEKMSLPFGALEICDRGKWRRVTIHDLLWAEQHTRPVRPRVAAVDRIYFQNATETNRFDAERRRGGLAAIQRLVQEFTNTYGNVSQHPWSFVTRSDIQVLDAAGVVDSASEAAQKLTDLRTCIDQTRAAFGELVLPVTLEGLSNLSERAAQIPAPGSSVDDRLLKSLLGTPELRPKLLRLMEAIEQWHHQHGLCAKLVTTPHGQCVLPAQLNAVVTQARQANLADTTLADIAAKAKQLRRSSADLKGFVAFSRAILERFGVQSTPITSRTLKKVLQAIDLLSSIDRNTLLARSAAVLDEQVHSVLAEAKNRLKELRERDAATRALFVMDDDFTVVEIRRHALVLRTAGFFGKFSGEFRIIRKTWTARFKGAELPADDRLAGMLVELANHVEARQSLEKDARLKAICGSRFFGLDTNIDCLLAANRLGAQIRSAFPGQAEPERSIRQLLLEGQADTLDDIRMLATDMRVARLREAVTRINDEDASLDKGAHALESNAIQAETVHAALIASGFHPTVTPNQAAGLPAILNTLQELEAELAEGGGAELLAGAWKGPATDVSHISAALEAAETLHSASIVEPLRALLVSEPEPVGAAVARIHDAAATLAQAIANAQQAVRAIVERVIHVDAWKAELARISASEPIEALAGLFQRASSCSDELLIWTRFRRAVSDARSDGVAPLLDAYDQAGEPYLDLVSACDRVLYRSLVKCALEQHPELGETTALSLDEIRARFCELDRRIMDRQRQELIGSLASKQIPPGIQSPRPRECSEATLIRNEIAKKRKHIPIRDLVARASRAIRAMKPCTMMSPASVAQYLLPGQSYDLVLIDEASQMRPEEAIGALARAHQAVIVGDPQQLPPSSFFNRQDASENQGDDDEFERIVAESILDIASTAFQPTRELLWHYRSRHGSLIAFSNHHFYDDRLIVFPSPQEGYPGQGVQLVPVPGQYRASVNVPEAQAVAKAAASFMANNPNKSLGIVALNQPQRDLILAEMDRLFVNDRVAERYRARWQNTLEPFFVKNLENVQGNEADEIFISTVYGADERGNLMQRFGPINGAAGDRRLNVLFSRAKHGITVFTSMKPDQIRVEASTPRGTKLLRDYLEFAATGRLGHGQDPIQECDSDFERFVKDRLQARGYEVVPQIGVAGYRIDLGVKHPEWPYGFLLGVECDGAAYHSSLSARDRDRLRQQVLESLGWTIYRVWSTDWFRDPNRELARMSAFIETVLAQRMAQQQAAASYDAVVPDEDQAGDLPENDDISPEEDDDILEEILDGHEVVINGVTPDDPEATAGIPADASAPAYGSYSEASFEELSFALDAGRFFAAEYQETLMQLIEHCVSQEGPIRDDILARRIGAAHGFQRTGNRIRDHVCTLARRIYRSTKEDVGRFFWPGDTDPDSWMTFRISQATEPRAIDEIAIQELRALALLSESDPRYQDEVPLVAMARIAGIQRLRASSRERLSRAKRGLHPTHTVSEKRESCSPNQNLNGDAARTIDSGSDRMGHE